MAAQYPGASRPFHAALTGAACGYPGLRPTVAHYGRFLPRLGPPVQPGGPLSGAAWNLGAGMRWARGIFARKMRQDHGTAEGLLLASCGQAEEGVGLTVSSAVGLAEAPAGAGPVVVDMPDNVWPDDPDAVPSWRLRQKAAAAARGVRIPGYDTRRAFEAAVALCIERETPPAPADVPLKKLAGPAAAARFVADLRSTGPLDAFSSEDLTAAYLDHCRRHHLEPIPENVLRPELLKLRGVTRRSVNIPNGGPGGRRARPARWFITSEIQETGDGFRAAA